MKTKILEFPTIKKRVARPMTQAEAAEKLGISISYMFMLTYGRRPLTEDLRKRMAKIGIKPIAPDRGERS